VAIGLQVGAADGAGIDLHPEFVVAAPRHGHVFHANVAGSAIDDRLHVVTSLQSDLWVAPHTVSVSMVVSSYPNLNRAGTSVQPGLFMGIAGWCPMWGRFPNLPYFRQVRKPAVFQAG